MKPIKTLLATTIALAGLSLTVAYADPSTNPPPAATHPHHGDHGPALEHLLSPKLVASLNLTADQQTAYAGLETSFKKDADKWNTDNPVDPQAYQTAKDSGDKEALRQFRQKRQGLTDIRKGYIDKLRADLTADQKTTLDKALDSHHQQKPAPKATPPATPPPSE